MSDTPIGGSMAGGFFLALVLPEGTEMTPAGSTEPKPITVTILTARKISGLGNTTIWSLIAQKKLVTVKVGRRVLVTYESLEKLLSPTAPNGARQ